MAEIKFKLMGEELRIVLYEIDEVIADVFFDDIKKEAIRLERIFNLYDEKSELSMLNNKRKITPSKELFEVIKKSADYSRLTKGKYDITMGKRILAQKKGYPLPKIAATYKDIKFTKNKIELTNLDVLIDVGSIAKGYVAEKLCDFMKNLGVESALIDARGDLIIFGDKEETVAIQHPRDKSKTIHPFILKNAGVATSGDYNQYSNSFDNSHIIGKNEIISATVVGPNITDADAIATCVMVIDTKEIGAFMKKNKDYKVFLIDKQLNEYFYNGFENLLVK